ncbi:MAG TPA: hypothetical protein VIH18_11280 [Candidatus Binatia bacterium]|jgi:hypothetical protein
MASADFHVCIVDEIDLSYRKRYEEYGAKVHLVPRVSSRHPPSNKLRFLELPEVGDSDRVVLLDCDTIVVQEPARLISKVDFVAKIADYPTTTPDIFKSLFAAFGLSLPAADQRCTVRGESTIPYFNSGVLSFSRKAMRRLVPEWTRINSDLIEKMELLKECEYFCEQASLSLALAATVTSFELLGNDMNFHAHVKEPLDSAFANTDPVIIHYHWLVNEVGVLEPSPYPNVNRRIQQFNDRLRKEQDSWVVATSVCCDGQNGPGALES